MYRDKGVLYRQVNKSGADAYDLLITSTLYADLAVAGLIIEHDEVDAAEGAYKTLKPKLVPFLSYPYEWSFSQLKAAALATLEIQKRALAKGLTLRDASAYNIQFVNGKPLIIDTLSFEAYRPGEPWQAYRQFCQHFLAPLALASYVDVNLIQLLRIHIDGVPLPLAAQLLPSRARLRFGLATHVSLHARMQTKHAGAGAASKAQVGLNSLLGLIDSLERTIKVLKAPVGKTEWGDYYEHTNYSKKALDTKATEIEKLLKLAAPKTVLDLGANDGRFSRLAMSVGANVVSADIDPVAVEHNYQEMLTNNETNILPLLIDLTNPSPALGWANAERQSFADRIQTDLVMALALVHHLAISNNVPLGMIADCFGSLAPSLIIEWVPKEDSQVQRLLETRVDIFEDYTQAGFEAAFNSVYRVTKKLPLAGTKRTLYLMTRLGS